MKRLVLAGGGHAHIEVLRDLAAAPRADLDATLVTPQPRLIYSGMVPGVVAGHFRLEECAIDVEALARRANVKLLLCAASALDPRARTLKCADGTVLPYDVVSLDVGSQVAQAAVPGVSQHATAVRPMERLLEGWGDTLRRVREGSIKSITIVGAGAAGIELALAMDHRLRGESPPPPHVRVITAMPEAVPELAPGARRRLLAFLAKRNIGCHANGTVTQVGRDHVRLANGLEFASDATFWATGAAPHEWLRASGLACDERGFVLTNDQLQSVTDARVFAAGDCATQEGRGYARAGVYAVRAAPVLARNLRAALDGAPLARHVSSRRYLAIVSAGSRHAVAAWNGFAVSGAWCWFWKERIDRRFVARYT